MKAMNSRGPDTAVIIAGISWLGSHLAQINVGIQCLVGLVSIIALIYAARYHSMKRRALERAMENDGENSGV